MSTLYGYQLNQLQRDLPTWQAPQWQVNPVFTLVSVGSPVAVSDGVVTGTPTPVVGYLISVDGVFKTWPYTLQAGDAGHTLQVIPIASNAAGVDYASILTAVPSSTIAPGQVVGLSISGLNSSGLTLTWSDPISGGTPSGYTAGYRVAGTLTWTTQASVGNTATLSGLAATTNYEIEVYGSNAAGAGSVAFTSVATPASGSGYWSNSFAQGINIAIDQNYYGNPVFSDRSLVFGANTFRATDGTRLQVGDFDATTNFPNKSFKFTAVGLTESRSLGSWTINYTANQQLSVTSSTSGNQVSTTWNSGTGVGQIVWNNTGVNSFTFTINFPGGTTMTAFAAYPPYVNPATDPFWVPQFLRTLQPYKHLRFMDWSMTNGDYYLDASKLTWAQSVEWSDRITPATVRLNSRVGDAYYQRGYPVEWMVDLCNTTGIDGWFNIPTTASDAFVTAYATHIATNLSAGLKSVWEYANEGWNPFLGSYYKLAIAAMYQIGAFTMFKADGSGNPYKSHATYTNSVASISCDGTRIALAFTNPHGITGNSDGVTGNYLTIAGMAAAYAAYVPKVNTVYRVDSTTTVSYLVSQATTPASCGVLSAVTSDTFLSSNVGFVALKAGNTSNGLMFDVRNTGTNLACAMLANGSTLNLYLYPQQMTMRQYDVMKLVKAAFAAAGRSADCQTTLSTQAGSPYLTFLGYENLYAVSGRTTPLNQVFDAINIGSYLALSQGNTVYGTRTTGFFNPILSASAPGTAATPSATIIANAQAQLRSNVDIAYGEWSYGSLAAYAKTVGLKLFCYEVGVDTSLFTATSDMTAVNLTDSGVPASSIKSMVQDWIYNMQEVGFYRGGWYHNGAYPIQSSTGCFSLGPTADSIDPTTSSAGWSPKFAGIMAAMTAPALISGRPANAKRATNHFFPCTLSAYDYVGNEAVYVNPTSWPNLSTTYDATNSTYYGPLKNGKTYYVRAESAGTATLNVKGHSTAAGAVALTVQVLGGAVAGTLSAGAHAGSSSVDADFGSLSVPLVAGPNYIFISAPAASCALVFPHVVSFQP